jgi:hypothetical protein
MVGTGVGFGWHQFFFIIHEMHDGSRKWIRLRRVAGGSNDRYLTTDYTDFTDDEK